MREQKPWLARQLARYPAVRVFISWLFSFVLTPKTMPVLFRLFGIKLPDQAHPGQMEQEVLQIVKQSTAQGDAQAVLDVMDNFVSSGKGMLINIGDAKTGLVDSVIAKHKPMVALELGTYIGYSAIATARRLPPGGKLYGIDPNAMHVQVAREMIQHAGLSDKVEIIQGVLETSIPELRKRGVQAVDYTLIDHVSNFFLKDLLILQNSGLLKKGSVVVADNVLLPGAPDFRKYVTSSLDFHTVEHVTDISSVHYLCDIVTVSEFCGSVPQS